MGSKMNWLWLNSQYVNNGLKKYTLKGYKLVKLMKILPISLDGNISN